jgi:hypothetical protein
VSEYAVKGSLLHAVLLRKSNILKVSNRTRVAGHRMYDNEVVSDKGRNSDVSKVKAELLPVAEVGSLSSNAHAHGLGHPSVSVVKKYSSGKLSVSRNSLTVEILSYIRLSNLKLTAVGF